jgi:hypothetical protein
MITILFVLYKIIFTDPRKRNRLPYHILIYINKLKKTKKTTIGLGEIQTTYLSLFGKLSHRLGYDNWCINSVKYVY